RRLELIEETILENVDFVVVHLPPQVRAVRADIAHLDRRRFVQLALEAEGPRLRVAGSETWVEVVGAGGAESARYQREAAGVCGRLADREVAVAEEHATRGEDIGRGRGTNVERDPRPVVGAEHRLVGVEAFARVGD